VNAHLTPGRPAGIAVDHGIFDAGHPEMANVPSWASASVRDRMDAAIVHEYIEATLQPPSYLRGRSAAAWLHNEAISRGPNTALSITHSAREILRQYRQAAGLAP
jgi:hypothetical protein